MSDVILSKRTTPAIPSTGKVKYFTNTSGEWCSINESGTVKVYAEGVTPEQVQDIVGAFFNDSTTIDVTYDDAGNAITAEVIQTALDHTQFLNIGSNSHAQIDSHIGNTSNPHGVTKAQVGLGSVPNVDATNPSNITQDATHRFVTDTEKTTWNSKEPAIAPGTTSQYWRGDKSWQTLDKSAVGLGNVDNTSDLLKPISTATQLALNAKYDASNPNNYETPTQLNARDTANRARANHTGTQLAATISDFASAVRSSVLTGLSLATNAAIDATDTVLTAFGKIQAQLNAHFGSGGSSHAVATTTVAGFMSATDKVKLDGITNDVFFRNATQYNNTSNATYVTCPELAVNCVAGAFYRIKWSIRHTSAATTTGFRPGLGGTATGTINFVGSVVGSITASTTNIISGPLSAFNTNIPATSSAGTQPTIAEIEGIFLCTTSGLIYPQFLSEVNGSQVSVLADSLCIYKEII